MLPRRWDRWRVLVFQALPVILLACQHPASSPDVPANRGGAAALQGRGQVVQVIAHPDDDILFMNPDLAADIHSGQPVASIYLTGGESDQPNPTEYAAHRQDGTREAYAHMAGVPNDWRRRSILVGEHRFVEVDQLASRPDVQVVFLNLPEDNNPGAAGGKHALTRLWSDEVSAVNTLLPDGGTVRDSYAYRRADVVDVLTELFAFFRPTVVRAQDPQPDRRYQVQWGRFHDHPDHVIAALFTQEALHRVAADHPDVHPALVRYRDYNIADAPRNLSQVDQAAKKDYFSAYVRHDSGANLGGAYKDWTERSYYRWTRGGSWAGRDRYGQLHAFAVDGSRLAHWWRTSDGWWHGTEMSSLPQPLRPTLTVLPDDDGRLVLVAQSMDGSEVLVKRQQSDGTWPAQWSNAGNPEQPGLETTDVGVPTAAIDADGYLAVFVNNARGGVSVRREAAPGGGSWEAGWNDIGGTDVQDGVTAVPDRNNLLHVFASTRDRILHWQEQEPHGEFEQIRSPFRQIRPAGPPVAVREPGGQVRIFARTGDDGRFAAVSDSRPLWWQVPSYFPNPGGMAPPVVTARESKTGPQSVIFVRNSAGGVSAARQEASPGDWVDLGGLVVDQPTAVVEANGSITLLATGTDGHLLINQDTPRTSGLDFHGWQLVPSAE